MASAKFVEWEKKYTWGTGIEVTANKVINLLLREANNLIKVNDNNEVYTDLQMQANTQFLLENIEVGATVGRVSTADGWQFTGTILAYKTASGTTNMWWYSDEWNLFFFNGSEWVWFYTKDQVDGIIAQVREEMANLAEELRQSISDLRDELYVVREEVISKIPTKNSQLENDSWFITVAVTGLENYYDKTTINNYLNEKADKTALTERLATKVDKVTTYEMTNLNMNEQGVITETFSNQQLFETLQIVKNALSTLYDGKASAIDTLNALNTKASIEYVDNLVGSTLWISTKVVDTLPVVWQWNYIYLVPVAWSTDNCEQFIWNSDTSSYVSLGTTKVDLSNYVTLNWNQEISGVKTYTAEPVLPANTADAENVNTKSARESQVYKVAQSVSDLANSVENTYATLTNLQEWLDNVSWDIWEWAITVQINSSTTGVTNPTFWVNQKTPQTIDLSINKGTVGLSNVDNTSDADKPVSTAQATAIAWAVASLAETIDSELENYSTTEQVNSAISTAVGTKQNALTPGTWISISQENVIANTWVTSVNWNSWAVTLKTINWTALDGSWNITVSWWHDYSWVTKSWNSIEIWLRTLVNPTSNFTLTIPANLQDWMEYVLRCINESSYTITLWDWFTNPWNVDLKLTSNATDQFVFVAINWTLELQAEVALA